MFERLRNWLIGTSYEYPELEFEYVEYISKEEHIRELNKLHAEMLKILDHKEELLREAEVQLQKVLERGER